MKTMMTIEDDDLRRSKRVQDGGVEGRETGLPGHRETGPPGPVRRDRRDRQNSTAKRALANSSIFLPGTPSSGDTMTRLPDAIDDVTLRAAATKTGQHIGARLVVLFGSAARGEVAIEDIDIGILGTGHVDVVAVTNELTQSLRSQAVDVTDLGRADPVLLALVARDGVPLFENEPGAFTRFVSLATRRFADTKKFRNAQAEALREISSHPRSS